MSKVMKDSGIPWIGEIPSHWAIIPFKEAVSSLTTGLNPRDNFELSKDGPLFYVTIRNFKDGKLFLDENCDRIDKRAWEIIQKRSCLQKGDILFASISKDAQCYILQDNPYSWNINESVFALRGNRRVITNEFLYYSLVNPEFYKALRIDATGTTFQSIKQNKLKDSVFVIPPVSEQQTIAVFLDKKCGEIDEMVSLQEKIVEELKAYKQSVITEAVCKGLNPDAPMKDSGIEWVGKIPSHWEVSRIKNEIILLDYLREPISAENRENKFGLYDYYGASGVIDKIDDYNVEGKVLLIGEDGANLLMRNLPLVYKADGKFWVNNHAHILKVKDENNYNYLAHLFEAGDYTLFITGSAQPKLSQDNLKNFPIPITREKAEQDAIADYLDSKCSEIDALISLKQSKIEALKEYKKSIIYEYVTGKKEVK